MRKTSSRIITVMLAVFMVFGAFTFAACPIFYTVRFLNHDNTVIGTPLSIEDGQTIAQSQIPPAPTSPQAGHVFLHWTADQQNPAVAFDFATPITRDIDLRPHFVDATTVSRVYFLIEEPNNTNINILKQRAATNQQGNIVSNHTIGQTITPHTPSRSGFNFVEWQVWSPTSTNTPAFNAATPLAASEYILFATWTTAPIVPAGRIMTNISAPDNVFSPFFATSGVDMGIAGLTQVSMLSVAPDQTVWVGDEVPSVARAYNYTVMVDITGTGTNFVADDAAGTLFNSVLQHNRQDPNFVRTEYEFVIKNDVRFSDGTPLTINDVIFSLHLFLDPMYRGSNTLNSTAIIGLNEYRFQNPSGDTRDLTREFIRQANERRDRLANYWGDLGQGIDDIEHFRADMLGTAAERQIIQDAQSLRAEIWDDLATAWRGAEGIDLSDVYENRFISPNHEDNSQWNCPTTGTFVGFTQPWEHFLYTQRYITAERNSDGSLNWLEFPISESRPRGPIIMNAAQTRIFAAEQLTLTAEMEAAIAVSPEADRAAMRNTLQIRMSGFYAVSYFYNSRVGILTAPERGRLNHADPVGAENIMGDTQGVTTDWHIDISTLTIDRSKGHEGNIFRTFNVGDNEGAVSSASRARATDPLAFSTIEGGRVVTNESATSRLIDTIGAATPFNATIGRNLPVLSRFSAAGNRLVSSWISEAHEAHLLSMQTGTGFLVPTVSGITVHTATSFNCRRNGQVSLTNRAGAIQQHDVLRIEIAGVDPGAIWRFSFTVAPMHYYSNPASVGEQGIFPVTQFGHTQFNMAALRDPSNPALGNSFNPGFPRFNNNYFTRVFRSQQLLRHPMGAGSYQVSDVAGRIASDPGFSSGGFFNNNTVYYRYNPHFYTTGHNMHIARTRYLTQTVIPSAQVINALSAGTISYASPMATVQNQTQIQGISHLGQDLVDNMGYGYVGINARNVPNIHVRRAIMLAIDPELSVEFFGSSIADVIHRGLSTTSWAFPETPFTPHATVDPGNDREAAIHRVLAEGGIVNRGGILVANTDSPRPDFPLEITFTVAGAETNHPAWQMLNVAANTLNTINFQGGNFRVRVTTDPNALSGISAGTLDVWAAAWGAGIDPDMFQVYHRDSQAVNVNAWGFPWLIGQQNATELEMRIIDDLADAIDQSRQFLVNADRIPHLHRALDLVMELAIEFPTYQRKNLFAWNRNSIDESTLNLDNVGPFSPPTFRLWEVQGLVGR